MPRCNFKLFISSLLTLTFALTALMACYDGEEDLKNQRFARFTLQPENVETLKKNPKLACVLEQLPFEALLFVSQSKVDGLYQLRFLDDVRELIKAEYVAIDFLQHAKDAPNGHCPDPSQMLGQSIPLTLDGCVRAYLSLGSCKNRPDLRILGSLDLTAFSIKRGELVKGSLQGRLMQITKVNTDGSTTQLAESLGQVQGDFHFLVSPRAILDW